MKAMMVLRPELILNLNSGDRLPDKFKSTNLCQKVPNISLGVAIQLICVDSKANKKIFPTVRLSAV